VTVERAEGVGVVLQHTSNIFQYTIWNPNTQLWSSFASIQDGETPLTTIAVAISSSEFAAHLVYRSSNGLNPNNYISFNDGSWSPPVIVANAISNQLSGDIGALSSEDVGLAFASSKNIQYIERTGSGWPSFANDIDTTTSMGNITISPSLVVLENAGADLMVVFVASDGKIYSRRRISNTWSPTLQIGSGTTTHRVAIAPLANNRAVVAFRGSDGKLYTSVHNGASPGTWSVPAPLSGGAGILINDAPALAPGVGVSPNGAIAELAYIATSDSKPYHVRCMATSGNPCATLSGPTKVSDTTVSLVSIASIH
jgi:hypothetical protein